MSRSKYPDLAESSFVICSLIVWSWIMLCSVTSDLSVCGSSIRLLASLILVWIDPPLCTI